MTTLRGMGATSRVYSPLEARHRALDFIWPEGSVTGVPVNTYLYSLVCRTMAINSGALSITGGEYQINHGDWSSSSGTLTDGDLLRVRMLSSSSHFTETVLQLNAGGFVYTYSSTTAEQELTSDILLDSFSGAILDSEGQYITASS